MEKEILNVEEAAPKDPWQEFAGVFADSPFFEEVMRNVAAERERQRGEAVAAAEVEERKSGVLARPCRSMRSTPTRSPSTCAATQPSPPGF